MSSTSTFLAQFVFLSRQEGVKKCFGDVSCFHDCFGKCGEDMITHWYLAVSCKHSMWRFPYYRKHEWCAILAEKMHKVPCSTFSRKRENVFELKGLYNALQAHPTLTRHAHPSLHHVPSFSNSSIFTLACWQLLVRAARYSTVLLSQSSHHGIITYYPCQNFEHIPI